MPEKSRKTLAAILLIVAVAIAATVIGFTWWNAQNTGEENATHYSKYGFSFEHPKDMSISEQGLLEDTANSNSGRVLGDLRNSEIELIKIDWITNASAPSLEVLLNQSYEDLKAEGLNISKGQLVNSTVSGHEMKYQFFTATAYDITFHGISSVWHCDTNANKRSYEFVFMQTATQDALPKFQLYINSFVCH